MKPSEYKTLRHATMKQVVLLVDDEAHIRRDLGDRLRKCGYNIHVVENAEKAKKVILSEKLDCAIVDLKIDWTSEFSGAKIVNFI